MQGDLISWGTSWTWAGTTNQVKSYASIVLGWQWGWRLGNTGLPVQLSAASQSAGALDAGERDGEFNKFPH